MKDTGDDPEKDIVSEYFVQKLAKQTRKQGGGWFLIMIFPTCSISIILFEPALRTSPGT